jgi:hypothetical protein
MHGRCDLALDYMKRHREGQPGKHTGSFGQGVMGLTDASPADLRQPGQPPTVSAPPQANSNGGLLRATELGGGLFGLLLVAGTILRLQNGSPPSSADVPVN